MSTQYMLLQVAYQHLENNNTTAQPTQHGNNIAINVTIQATYLRESSSCQHHLQTRHH